jgi:tripartite-type tricarboxylate transporter receptor subunit TctC
MKLTAALVLALAAGIASAQPYPSKPIRLIVGFPPGGSADPTTRIIGHALSEQMNVPVIVENRPGADSAIATEQMTRTAPDGYTIMFASNSGVVAPIALRKEAPYDPLTQLTPISDIGWPTTRAVMSTLPPGTKPWMKRMGLDG